MKTYKVYLKGYTVAEAILEAYNQGVSEYYDEIVEELNV